MDLLTTAEAASYLRLKERKIYELVADGAIPCTKVTGKWLFPRHELDRWLTDSLTRPDGVPAAPPMPIIGGSHDPLLDWALRESGSKLATLPEGSEAGLDRFARREIMGAAIHLHSLDDPARDSNIDAVRGSGQLADAVLVAFCRREQGLLLPQGNPRDLGSLKDARDKKARVAVRPRGAGAQLLFLALIRRDNLDLAQFNLMSPPCPTGPDVAQAVRAGRADCGIATRSVAAAAGLDFKPLMWERFDLVVRQRDYFHPPLQALLALLRAPMFRDRADELGGYDVSDAGTVRSAAQ